MSLLDRRSVLTCALTCWIGFVSCQASAATGADLILTNGRVYTDNPKSRWSEPVAVKGGKIIYVGSSASGLGSCR